MHTWPRSIAGCTTTRRAAAHCLVRQGERPAAGGRLRIAELRNASPHPHERAPDCERAVVRSTSAQLKPSSWPCRQPVWIASAHSAASRSPAADGRSTSAASSDGPGGWTSCCGTAGGSEEWASNWIRASSERTRRNLAALALPLELLHTDYQTGLGQLSLPPDQLVVAFIAPRCDMRLSDAERGWGEHRHLQLER